MEDGEFFREGPWPIGLASVLAYVEQGGAGPFEEEDECLLIRIDAIDEGIIESEEDVPFSFAEFALVYPHFLQTLLEGCTVVAAEGDDAQAVLHPSHLILGSDGRIGEGGIHGIDEDAFEDVQLVVYVDCAVCYLIEDGEGDLQFSVLLDLEGEYEGERVGTNDAQVAIACGGTSKESIGGVGWDGVRKGEDFQALLWLIPHA